jgi:hypothetical protein
MMRRKNTRSFSDLDMWNRLASYVLKLFRRYGKSLQIKNKEEKNFLSKIESMNHRLQWNFFFWVVGQEAGWRNWSKSRDSKGIASFFFNLSPWANNRDWTCAWWIHNPLSWTTRLHPLLSSTIRSFYYIKTYLFV